MKHSAKSIQDQLARQGLVFTELELHHLGQFSPHDADWNYKDIPHLNEVHKLVDGVPALVQDDLICNFFLQRVGPIRFPLAVTNYSFTKDRQVYFTTAWFFVLVIETHWSLVGDHHTQVTTTYSVGSPRIFRPLHGIVRGLLKRNYRTLMSADIPMRTRRGLLRQRGYRFKSDSTGYTFLETLRTGENNLIAPPQGRTEIMERNIEQVSSQDLLLGSNDLSGVRLVVRGGQLISFPRICEHEGADLDSCEVSSNLTLRCPWHGRMIKGLVVDRGNETQVTSMCSVRRNDDSFTVTLSQCEE